MATLLENMKIEIEKQARKIKERAKIENVESLEDVMKILEKQYDAEIQHVEFINPDILGMVCANNDELTIFLNRNSMYDYDNCYTALYLLGYYIFQHKYVYAYIYSENCDILGELELKAFYFAEKMMGIAQVKLSEI